MNTTSKPREKSMDDLTVGWSPGRRDPGLIECLFEQTRAPSIRWRRVAGSRRVSCATLANSSRAARTTKAGTNMIRPAG